MIQPGSNIQLQQQQHETDGAGRMKVKPSTPALKRTKSSHSVTFFCFFFCVLGAARAHYKNVGRASGQHGLVLVLVLVLIIVLFILGTIQMSA